MITSKRPACPEQVRCSGAGSASQSNAAPRGRPRAPAMRQCLDAAPGRVLAAAGRQAPGEEHGAPSWSGFIKGMAEQRSVRLTTALGDKLRFRRMAGEEGARAARSSFELEVGSDDLGIQLDGSARHGHGGGDRPGRRRPAASPRAGQPLRVRRLRERRGALPRHAAALAVVSLPHRRLPHLPGEDRCRRSSRRSSTSMPASRCTSRIG